jgi:hypothetical protein
MATPTCSTLLLPSPSRPTQCEAAAPGVARQSAYQEMESTKLLSTDLTRHQVECEGN